eukprot:scaffold262378_cov28-Tisochrysis_lutea.AAC.6
MKPGAAGKNAATARKAPQRLRCARRAPCGCWRQKSKTPGAAWHFPKWTRNESNTWACCGARLPSDLTPRLRRGCDAFEIAADWAARNQPSTVLQAAPISTENLEDVSVAKRQTDASCAESPNGATGLATLRIACEMRPSRGGASTWEARLRSAVTETPPRMAVSETAHRVLTSKTRRGASA